MDTDRFLQLMGEKSSNFFGYLENLPIFGGV